SMTQNVFGVVDPGALPPLRMRHVSLNHGAGGFFPDDIEILPDIRPELFQLSDRPVPQIQVGIHGKMVFGIHNLHELMHRGGLNRIRAWLPQNVIAQNFSQRGTRRLPSKLMSINSMSKRLPSHIVVEITTRWCSG